MKVHDKKCSSNNFMLPFMRIVRLEFLLAVNTVL
jgi:hypothetical protein